MTRLTENVAKGVIICNILDNSSDQLRAVYGVVPLSRLECEEEFMINLWEPARVWPSPCFRSSLDRNSATSEKTEWWGSLHQKIRHIWKESQTLSKTHTNTTSDAFQTLRRSRPGWVLVTAVSSQSPIQTPII
eukprot:gene12964-15235_t